MQRRRKEVALRGRVLSTVMFAALIAGVPMTARAGASATAAPRSRDSASAHAVSDANVAQRVVAARGKSDQKALADYYTAKAAQQEESIAHFDQLLRAYMKLEGKQMEPLQRHARALLKAARMLKQRYEILAQAHLNLAFGD